jgi:N-hydroxyarylamine O-acetyltransferase
MSDDNFDVDGWLRRIGHTGPYEPTLSTLRAMISAHTSTIPFENIDVLLGRPPRLDLGSLRQKLVMSRRGGYCFEQNTLLLAGLAALGFRVTGLLARVIRGMDADASGPATHMLVRVELPEGPFLADVGFGNQTPTAPLAMRPGIEQETPHETMRLWPVGEELTLQAKLGEDWQNIYRLSPHPRFSVDYEVANWFTATHPASLFVNNLIVARPEPDRTRRTLFNGQVTVRHPGGRAERSRPDGEAELSATLESTFGLTLSDADLTGALEALERKGTRGASHPFFA